MHVDVLDCHFLLAFASMPAQRLDQRGIGSARLGPMIQAHVAAFKGLFREHCPPVALHRSAMAGDHLRGDHSFDFVARIDADKRGDYAFNLPVAGFGARIFGPKRLPGLICQREVPIIAFAAAYPAEWFFHLDRFRALVFLSLRCLSCRIALNNPPVA